MPRNPKKRARIRERMEAEGLSYTAALRSQSIERPTPSARAAVTDETRDELRSMLRRNLTGWASAHYSMVDNVWVCRQHGLSDAEIVAMSGGGAATAEILVFLDEVDDVARVVSGFGLKTGTSTGDTSMDVWIEFDAVPFPVVLLRHPIGDRIGDEVDRPRARRVARLLMSELYAVGYQVSTEPIDLTTLSVDEAIEQFAEADAYDDFIVVRE